MADDQNGLTPLCLGQCREYCSLSSRVQRGCSFIENQNRTLLHDGASQGEALPLAA